MKALRKHCQEPWILLYVERWLKALMQTTDGQILERDKGTPQGGVVSPLLANLLPTMRCFTARASARRNMCLDRIQERFRACKLELHSGKTHIVYCKDLNRT